MVIQQALFLKVTILTPRFILSTILALITQLLWTCSQILHPCKQKGHSQLHSSLETAGILYI